MSSGSRFYGPVHVGAALSETSSRSLRDLVQVFGLNDLPTIGELDPYLLGATSSAFGRSGEYGRRDSYVPRTAGRVDERLAQALTGDRLVVMVGPSKAGKTRTLFEAVRSYDRQARLVWPTPDGVGELAAHPRITGCDDTLVVWLDDLHLYLTRADPLTPATLARLRARRGPTVVVATLRSEMRAQLRGAGELRQETRLLLEQALTIDLAPTSEDPDERTAAARAYPGQAGTSGEHGLGEVLAGAPELLARYDDARAADPPLHAVIAVAVDWARIGRTEPIPEPTLIDLTLQHLRTTHPHLDTTSTNIRHATLIARTPPAGAGRAAALRTTYLDDDTRGYTAFDYLIAADAGQDHRQRRPIPDTYWHNATQDCDPQTLTAVGLAAYQQDDHPIAATLWRKAADAGDSRAMLSLGFLLKEDGARAQAETWYRKAADAGNSRAMLSLGFLLKADGARAQAETWYRKAADAGNSQAMLSLGILLNEDGDRAQAETWYRKAADVGNRHAMSSLGFLLKEEGDRVQAEIWWRKAADAGDTFALLSLAVLLYEEGDRVQAKTWYRKFADAGDISLIDSLAILYAKGPERR
ncbi:tetratricopeptide repeat protein [Nocardia sp. NPDC003482]